MDTQLVIELARAQLYNWPCKYMVFWVCDVRPLGKSFDPHKDNDHSLRTSDVMLIFKISFIFIIVYLCLCLCGYAALLCVKMSAVASTGQRSMSLSHVCTGHSSAVPSGRAAYTLRCSNISPLHFSCFQ